MVAVRLSRHSARPCNLHPAHSGVPMDPRGDAESAARWGNFRGEIKKWAKIGPLKISILLGLKIDTHFVNLLSTTYGPFQ